VLEEEFSVKPVFQGFKGKRLKDDERYALDGSKLRQLGWSPKTGFFEGVRRTIKWYQENRWFWEYFYTH